MSTDGTRLSEAEEEQPENFEAKPYEPPRILSRDKLEAIAAACTTGGKAISGASSCNFSQS